MLPHLDVPLQYKQKSNHLVGSKFSAYFSYKRFKLIIYPYHSYDVAMHRASMFALTSCVDIKSLYATSIQICCDLDLRYY